jgi:hypothetical protein
MLKLLHRIHAIYRGIDEIDHIYKKIIEKLKLDISKITFDSNIPSAIDACPRSKNSKCLSLPPSFSVEFPRAKPLKVLWSGWVMGTQWLACNISKMISHKNGQSYAIEQTMYPKTFVDEFGTWDSQLEKLKKMLNDKTKTPLTKEEEAELINVRKKIWDYLSLEWAKNSLFEYVLVVLPAKNFNINSTLAKIELPNLYEHSKICFIIYDCLNGTIQFMKTSEIVSIHKKSLLLNDEQFLNKQDAMKLYFSWVIDIDEIRTREGEAQ